MNKKKTKHIIPAVLIAALVAYAALCIALPSEKLHFEQLFSELAHGLVSIGLYLLLTLFLACIAYAFVRLLDKKLIKQRMQAWAAKVSHKLLLIHAEETSIYLQSFLYSVLVQNKAMLSLPVGCDSSCLLAPGSGFHVRKNAVFYRYALLMSDKPELDRKALQQIMRAYIWTELSQHGIPGLPHAFLSKVYGLVASVYLDRILYNEEQHTLYIDILYVSSEDSATYAVEANKRDNASAVPAAEVFDDEVG